MSSTVSCFACVARFAGNSERAVEKSVRGYVPPRYAASKYLSSVAPTDDCRDDALAADSLPETLVTRMDSGTGGATDAEGLGETLAAGVV
ncbi:MAG TPA: hypothetical protein DIT48_08800 [Actinobacteria bacterium]|nr:hypothetical protein [Actinomycetota bacterium]